MRKLYSVVASLILTISIFAQAPQQFSYQAVVRGANNVLAVNKQVGMRISLLQDSATGNAVYIETHTPLSNANGLVSIAIGNGKVVNGTFATIDWSKGPYFVKIETDVTGGTTYTLNSTSQLLSVPYSLYSANDKDEQKLSVSSSGDTLYLQNGGYVIIPGISSAQPKPTPTSGYGPNITDIDGNTYKTVYIGTQHWMAENLKVSKLNDGTNIPYVINNQPKDYSPSVWAKLSSMAYTYFSNDITYNNSIGKLYNGFVINTGKVCPVNWHIPTKYEWDTLINYLGDSLTAGWKLKETGLLHWSVLNINNKATNESLFNALPSGSLVSDATGGANNNMSGINIWAVWWTNTESGNKQKYNRCFLTTYDNGVISTSYQQSKTNGSSIRCIKD